MSAVTNSAYYALESINQRNSQRVEDIRNNPAKYASSRGILGLDVELNNGLQEIELIAENVAADHRSAWQVRKELGLTTPEHNYLA